jgi:hypothetical protein
MQSGTERLKQEVIAVEKQGRGDGWGELVRESGVIVYSRKVQRERRAHCAVVGSLL